MTVAERLTSNEGMSFSRSRPSLLQLCKYRFGDHTRNLEHRRVNFSPKTQFGICKSRRLRIERKALVSCPTLKQRLSLQRTTRAILRRVRAATARESSRAPQSLPQPSVCD